MTERVTFLGSLRPGAKVVLKRETVCGDLTGEVVSLTEGSVQIRYDLFGVRVEWFDLWTGRNERGTLKILTPEDLRIKAEIASRRKPISAEGGGPRLRLMQLKKR